MPTNYLQHFPKPLLKDLLQGRWLPVIGAGMSLNAIIPKGMEMPMWGKLADLLAEDLADFSPNNALDAISAYEHEFGRAKLIERLAELLLINEAQPGIAHKEFCSIKFDTVCTTNFDFLLERQYDLIPAHVHPVVDEDQLSINLSGAGTLLLKLHGDLRHPTRLVASETDYDSFLTSFPLLATYLSNLLITRTAVFIGYSLDDPELIVRMLIVDVLGEQGYQALEAHDGPSALKIIESGVKLDLLITDVGLPGGMNGRQVADAARNKQPELKVLFVTGYAENAVIGNGHLDHGMHVLTKPFPIDELGRRVQEILASNA